MEKGWINGELFLPCPEGFGIMDEAELSRVYSCANPNRWGAWDKARHVMITVLWQRYNPLLAWLADRGAMVRRNEQLTRKGYRENDYRLIGFFSRAVCGLSAEGYRFTYRVQGVPQGAQTVLVKKGRTVYSVSCIGAAEALEENRVLFEAILDSAQVR